MLCVGGFCVLVIIIRISLHPKLFRNVQNITEASFFLCLVCVWHSWWQKLNSQMELFAFVSAETFDIFTSTKRSASSNCLSCYSCMHFAALSVAINKSMQVSARRARRQTAFCDMKKAYRDGNENGGDQSFLLIEMETNAIWGYVIMDYFFCNHKNSIELNSLFINQK